MEITIHIPSIEKLANSLESLSEAIELLCYDDTDYYPIETVRKNQFVDIKDLEDEILVSKAIHDALNKLKDDMSKR